MELFQILLNFRSQFDFMIRVLIGLLIFSSSICNCFAQQLMSRLPNRNVLYIGVSNPIEIIACGYKLGDINITADNGRIVRGEGSTFSVFPNETPFIKIKYTIKGKTIAEEEYRVKSTIDGLRAVLGPIEDEGSMSKSNIQAYEGISFGFECMEVYTEYLLKYYRLRILRDGISYVDERFDNGPRFDEKAKSILKNIKIGDEVLFSDMKFCIPNAKSDQLYKTPNPYIRVKIK